MTNLELIYETKIVLWNLQYTSWINEELFSFTWWFTLLFMAVGYVIWWKLLDKSRFIELLLFGSLLAVIAAVTDTIADNLTLWLYKVRIFPLMPAFFPYHLTLIPIFLMLVYQYTKKWSTYLLGTVLASVIYSFVFVPLFVAVGEIQFIKWNYGYTFMLTLVRAVLARWVLMLSKHIQTSYRGEL